MKTYLSGAELQEVIAHRGDKEALILHWQYEAIRDLHEQRIHPDHVDERA